MNRSRFLLGSFLLLLVSELYSGGYRTSFVKPAEGGLDYIKLASRGGLCGGVTIKQKKVLPGKGELWLRAFRYKSEKAGGKRVGDCSLSQLDFPGGRRFRYDWAGIAPTSHYKILCFSKYRDMKTQLNCSEYVELIGIKHNVGCVSGPAGPSRMRGIHLESAKYPPLNMNRHAKEIKVD